MQSVKIALTQNDQDLLQTYAATMDGLADYLGSPTKSSCTA
jgi:hypothetical protein